MAVKLIFGLALLALLAVAGWRLHHTEAVQAWMYPRDQKPPPIQFDNGSVRQPAAASDAAVVLIKPPGGFRKCRKGKTVVYTDRTCPDGTLEEATAKGTLTVLPGPKPASAPKAAADAAELRDKRIERIVNQ